MIYILIPVFNEAANLPNLISELKVTLPGHDKLVVFSDDGSTDNFYQLLEQKAGGLNYKILGDGQNRGPGAAFNAGFNWILQHSKSRTDCVITMEADTTSDISLLPKMLAIHELGYEMVLASVYAQGGEFEGTGFFRKLISTVANLLFRLLFNIKALTLSSFYRVYDISLLRRIKNNNKDIISESGFICKLELLVKAIREKATIIEVPMVLQSNKRKGESKMRVMKTTWQYLLFFIKTKKSGSPEPYALKANEELI